MSHCEAQPGLPTLLKPGVESHNFPFLCLFLFRCYPESRYVFLIFWASLLFLQSSPPHHVAPWSRHWLKHPSSVLLSSTSRQSLRLIARLPWEFYFSTLKLSLSLKIKQYWALERLTSYWIMRLNNFMGTRDGGTGCTSSDSRNSGNVKTVKNVWQCPVILTTMSSQNPFLACAWQLSVRKSPVWHEATHGIVVCRTEICLAANYAPQEVHC